MRTTTPPKDNIILAALMAITAFFSFTVMSLFAKLLSETHHVIEIAFWRNFLPLIPVSLWIYLSGQKHLFKMTMPVMTIVRSLIGITSLTIMFAAYANLPMADATVLFMTSVLVTPILSFIFLREQFGIHRWSAIFFGLAGVIIMVGPTGQLSFWGTIFGLTTAVLHAVLSVILRGMRAQSGTTTVFYFMLIGAIATSIFVPSIAAPFTNIEIIYLLACSAFGLTGQFLLNAAFQRSPTYIISPLGYTGLIWSTGFDIILWSVIPGWPVFMGAAMIFVANLYILYREQIKTKKVK